MGLVATAFPIVSALGQSYAQNSALIAQGEANKRTARNYITSMNYTLQNLEQERRDAFEATIDELEKTKLQGNRLIGGVVAAVNEGLMGGGRTANALKRSVKADLNRTLTQTKSNYQKKSNEIDLNKEATLLNTHKQIGSIQEVEKPSLFATLMNIGTAYLGMKSTIESLDGIRQGAGIGGGTNRTPLSGASQRWINEHFTSFDGYKNAMGGSYDFTYINPYMNLYPNYKSFSLLK